MINRLAFYNCTKIAHIRLLIFATMGLICLHNVPLASAGNSASATAMYCYGYTPASTDKSPKLPIYYSGVFDPIGIDKNTGPYNEAFGKYLHGKKIYYGNSGCTVGGRVAVETSFKEAVAKAKADGYPVAETGWMYGAAPPEAPPSTPAASPAPAASSQPQVMTPAAPSAPAAHASNSSSSGPTKINGVYNGTYSCAIGPRTLKLSLNSNASGSLTGTFTFYIPPTSHTKAYSYSMNGRFDPATGKFTLVPLKWDAAPPSNYVMVGLNGVFNPQARKVSGQVDYSGCGAFEASAPQGN